jgi:hypothetical protein
MAIGIATGYGLRYRRFVLRVPIRAKHFLFTLLSRPIARPTEPHIEWVPGYIPERVKQPERETDRDISVIDNKFDRTLA